MGDSLEYTYVVVDVDLITDDMVNAAICNETSYRKSLDSTKAILKFNTKHPNSLSGYPKYDQAEMDQFLIDNAVDWEP